MTGVEEPGKVGPMTTIELPETTPEHPFVRVTTAGETFYATDIERRSTGAVHVFRTGHFGYVRLVSELRSVELLTAAEYLAAFEVGTRVIVPKYGDTYVGRVMEIGRTRLVVRFLTRGGKVKTMSFAIRDVGIVR